MITITTDKTLLDIDFIYGFLHKSYWAKDRTKAQIQETIANSLCFGIFLSDKQIGFARVVTDKVIFSHLMDVFIAPEHQGKGYGKIVLETIYKHPDLINVTHHYLHTKDAHSFYQKIGFSQYDKPKNVMLKH